MKTENFSQNAYSKNLIIEIPKYKFNHHPLGDNLEDEDKERYAGREKIKEQFLQYLVSGSHKGAYLISGYRGMGKTSFVKKTIDEYKNINKTKKIKNIELSFAQQNLNEEDILKQLTQELLQYFEEENILVKFYKTLNISFIFYSLLFITLSFWFWNKEYSPFMTFLNLLNKGTLKFELNLFNNCFNTSDLLQYIIWSGALLIVNVIYIYMFLRFFYKFCIYSKLLFTFFSEGNIFSKLNFDASDIGIYKSLLNLTQRSNSSTIEEANFDSNNILKSLPFSLFSKKSKTIPIINAKDIESELINIFKRIKSFEPIVVFDELDKIEHKPDWKISGNNEINELQSFNSTKEQKATVISILSNLKYFITEAKCRFIFIAGREMFDAALADIADRQSFISSIFHHVIYVDSFLKDTPTAHNTGITYRVEEYLSTIIFSNYSKSEKEVLKGMTDEPFLRKYYKLLEKEIGKSISKEDLLKTIYVLQNFIIYVTYRSNGSPKKMSRIIEEHIRPSPLYEPSESKNRSEKIWRIKPAEKFKHINIESSQNSSSPPTVLYISYDNQYRNSYITYLFRPFLLNFSNYAKRLSDKILVAMPFLIDHILKFHPFAFSVENLELLPEVISSNSNPLVRGFIGDLLEYLRQNHLERTEMGLFDFRYNKKTSDELNFISKVFEEESAAFNFTLDEMQAVKTYLQNRVKIIKDKYSKSNVLLNKSETIFSLSFMESLLGDTYYFDKEYDLAISSYLDSLQTMRASVESKDMDVFFSIIRLKLKIGLMYEQIKKYDLSLSYYYDAISFYLKRFKENLADDEKFQIKKTDISDHLFFKALMAFLTVTEKKNYNGLSQSKITEVLKLVDSLQIASKSSKELNLALSDFHNDLGTLLFYKNHVPSITQEKNSVKVYSNELIRILIFDSYGTNAVNTTEIISYGKASKDYRPAVVSFGRYKQALLYLVVNKERQDILNTNNEDDYLGKRIKKIASKAYPEKFETIGLLNFNYLRENFDIESDSDKETLNYSRVCTLLKNAASRIVDYNNSYLNSYLKLQAYTLSSIGDFLFGININQLTKLDFLYDKAFYYNYINTDFQTIINNLNFNKSIYSNCSLVTINIKQVEDLFPSYFKSFKDENIEILENYFLYISKTLNRVETYNNMEFEFFFFIYSKLNWRKKFGPLKSVKVRPMKFWDDITFMYFDNLEKGKKTYLYKRNLDGTPIGLDDDFNESELIIFTYYLSARYYSKSGLDHNFLLNIKKIIEMIRHQSNFPIPKSKSKAEASSEKEKIRYILDFIEETLIHMMLESASWISISTDRPQMHKYKYYQGLDKEVENNGNKLHHPPLNARFNYFNLSNSPEVKEIVLNMALLKIKYSDYAFSKVDMNNFKKTMEDFLNKDLPEFKLISSQYSPNSQYSRLLEMNLATRVNRLLVKNIYSEKFPFIKLWETKIYRDYKNALKLNKGEAYFEQHIEKKLENLYENKAAFSFFEELIASSIYQLNQIIKTYSIFQSNPYLSYSNFAFYHKRLGRWLKFYNLCLLAEAKRNKNLKKENESFKIDDMIKNLVGTNLSLISLDSTSQFQIALQYFHKAKQFHSNGVAYQKDIDSRIYLEGDYEDLFYNFGIAIERHKVNSDKIREEIRKLELELSGSPLYDYASFTKGE